MSVSNFCVSLLNICQSCFGCSISPELLSLPSWPFSEFVTYLKEKSYPSTFFFFSPPGSWSLESWLPKFSDSLNRFLKLSPDFIAVFGGKFASPITARNGSSCLVSNIRLRVSVCLDSLLGLWHLNFSELQVWLLSSFLNVYF